MSDSAYRSLAERVPLGYVRHELGDDVADIWLQGEPARPIVDGGFTVTFEKRGPDGSPRLPRPRCAGGEVALEEGSYDVAYVPVIKTDGGMLKPRTSAAVGDGNGSAKVAADEVAAGDVTADEVSAVLDEVAKAVSKGDSSLKGDAGKNVADKAASAAKGTGKLDESKIEEKKSDAESSAEQPSAPSAPSQQPAASQPSSGGASSGDVASTPASQPSQPAHVHDWQPVTEQHWVSNIVTVVDREAYTSHEVTGSVVVCACGQRFSSTAEWGAHVKSIGRQY